METKSTARGPEAAPTTSDVDRAWDEIIRSLGDEPAPGTWPPRFPEPIKPRFYLLRKWVIWPVRRFIRRRLR